MMVKVCRRWKRGCGVIWPIFVCHRRIGFRPKEHDSAPVVDVVIVGGGMCGLLAWHALQSGGIRNVRILDAAPDGFEGPWLTYARMETLRSPKHLTGPAYGHGALTFQAWYRAQFGMAAWEALDKIPRPMWMDYLRWYRHTLGVPVENGVRLEQVSGEGDLLRLDITDPEKKTIFARKLIMATGRDGTGHPNIPDFMDGVPKRLWAHSAEDIAFPELAGRRVAVIGVGASAVDNAAEALEAGAAEVRHIARRREMPRINKMMGIGSYGFTAGYAELSDALALAVHELFLRDPDTITARLDVAGQPSSERLLSFRQTDRKRPRGGQWRRFAFR